IAHLRDLCKRMKTASPADMADHLNLDTGPFELRWERHTEFSTYTVFRKGPSDNPFTDTALSVVPSDWIESLPGDLLVGAHVALIPREIDAIDRDTIAGHFGSTDFVGSTVSGGSASVFTDFRLLGDSFGRIVIYEHEHDPNQTGRTFQRVLEVETYRMMALLAFPAARNIRPRLTDLESQMSQVTADIGEPQSSEEESALLNRLTNLSASAEQLAGETEYRFAAARAYHQIVNNRIDELEEEPYGSQQTLNSFMARRLEPAMKTCEATQSRLHTLEQRISRATALLRTRINVALEEQNAALLARMNQRAQLQLKLQQTVEGLSVVAISYYTVSLLYYVFLAGFESGWPIDPTIATGLAVPVVLFLAWFALRVLRRRLTGKSAN
ncbi:MAG: DUF3422 domain-containing protein, partial [Pseudomonadota bacterium]